MSRPARPRASCFVLACDGAISSPDHSVEITPTDALRMPAMLCAEHWLRIDEGEPWMWDSDPGDPADTGPTADSRIGHILMGRHLVERGIVVADQPGDITNRPSVFSPHLGDRFTPTLSIEGRVFGSNQRAHIEVALTPETIKHLRRWIGP